MEYSGRTLRLYADRLGARNQTRCALFLLKERPTQKRRRGKDEN